MSSSYTFVRPGLRTEEQKSSVQIPKIHTIALFTGGLTSLYEQIKNGVKSPSTRSYTDQEGHFLPEAGLVLACRYHVQSRHIEASGQSAVLVKAQDCAQEMQEVVIKVTHTDYFSVGVKEVQSLRRLCAQDPRSVSHCIRLLNAFIFGGHVCMVFPALDPRPLTQVLAEKSFNRPQKLRHIRKIAVHLLSGLAFLKSQNTIHADVKPENILIQKGADFDTVTLVDFGNAIHHTHQEVSLYFSDFQLQTLPYRAPEHEINPPSVLSFNLFVIKEVIAILKAVDSILKQVHVGNPFSVEIDMWSLGCVLLELYTGTVAFAGTNRFQVLEQMVSLLGPLPSEMCLRGKFCSELESLSTRISTETTSGTRKLMSAIPSITDYDFANFLSGLLSYHPDKRLTPWQAIQHPFIMPEICIYHFLPDSVPPSHVVDRSDYGLKQNISTDVLRMYPSTYDLLWAGTSSIQLASDHIRVARVEPWDHNFVGCDEEISGGRSNRMRDDIQGSGGNGRGAVLPSGSGDRMRNITPGGSGDRMRNITPGGSGDRMNITPGGSGDVMRNITQGGSGDRMNITPGGSGDRMRNITPGGSGDVMRNITQGGSGDRMSITPGGSGDRMRNITPGGSGDVMRNITQGGSGDRMNITPGGSGDVMRNITQGGSGDRMNITPSGSGDRMNITPGGSGDRMRNITPSGSGDRMNITPGGNGDRMRIITPDGSGDRVNITPSVSGDRMRSITPGGSGDRMRNVIPDGGGMRDVLLGSDRDRIMGDDIVGNDNDRVVNNGMEVRQDRPISPVILSQSAVSPRSHTSGCNTDFLPRPCGKGEKSQEYHSSMLRSSLTSQFPHLNEAKPQIETLTTHSENQSSVDSTVTVNKQISRNSCKFEGKTDNNISPCAVPQRNKPCSTGVDWKPLQLTMFEPRQDCISGMAAQSLTPISQGAPNTLLKTRKTVPSEEEYSTDEENLLNVSSRTYTVKGEPKKLAPTPWNMDVATCSNLAQLIQRKDRSLLFNKSPNADLEKNTRMSLISSDEVATSVMNMKQEPIEEATVKEQSLSKMSFSPPSVDSTAAVVHKDLDSGTLNHTFTLDHPSVELKDTSKQRCSSQSKLNADRKLQLVEMKNQKVHARSSLQSHRSCVLKCVKITSCRERVDKLRNTSPTPVEGICCKSELNVNVPSPHLHSPIRMDPSCDHQSEQKDTAGDDANVQFHPESCNLASKDSCKQNIADNSSVCRTLVSKLKNEKFSSKKEIEGRAMEAVTTLKETNEMAEIWAGNVRGNDSHLGAMKPLDLLEDRDREKHSRTNEFVSDHAGVTLDKITVDTVQNCINANRSSTLLQDKTDSQRQEKPICDSGENPLPMLRKRCKKISYTNTKISEMYTGLLLSEHQKIYGRREKRTKGKLSSSVRKKKLVSVFVSPRKCLAKDKKLKLRSRKGQKVCSMKTLAGGALSKKNGPISTNFRRMGNSVSELSPLPKLSKTISNSPFEGVDVPVKQSGILYISKNKYQKEKENIILGENILKRTSPHTFKNHESDTLSSPAAATDMAGRRNSNGECSLNLSIAKPVITDFNLCLTGNNVHRNQYTTRCHSHTAQTNLGMKTGEIPSEMVMSKRLSRAKAVKRALSFQSPVAPPKVACHSGSKQETYLRTLSPSTPKRSSQGLLFRRSKVWKNQLIHHSSVLSKSENNSDPYEFKASPVGAECLHKRNPKIVSRKRTATGRFSGSAKRKPIAQTCSNIAQLVQEKMKCLKVEVNDAESQICEKPKREHQTLQATGHCPVMHNLEKSPCDSKSATSSETKSKGDKCNIYFSTPRRKGKEAGNRPHSLKGTYPICNISPINSLRASSRKPRRLLLHQMIDSPDQTDKGKDQHEGVVKLNTYLAENANSECISQPVLVSSSTAGETFGLVKNSVSERLHTSSLVQKKREFSPGVTKMDLDRNSLLQEKAGDTSISGNIIVPGGSRPSDLGCVRVHSPLGPNISQRQNSDMSVPDTFKSAHDVQIPLTKMRTSFIVRTSPSLKVAETSTREDEKVAGISCVDDEDIILLDC